MEKTIVCGNCRFEGSMAEFSYVALAGGRGPGALLRCPACCELVIVEDYVVSVDSTLKHEPWDLKKIGVVSLSDLDREVENDQV